MPLGFHLFDKRLHTTKESGLCCGVFTKWWWLVERTREREREREREKRGKIQQIRMGLDGSSSVQIRRLARSEALDLDGETTAILKRSLTLPVMKSINCDSCINSATEEYAAASPSAPLLPCRQQQQQQQCKRRRRRTSGITSASGSKLRTLIVDDNAVNVALLCKLAQRHLADLVEIESIRTATDGYEAITIFDDSCKEEEAADGVESVVASSQGGYFDYKPSRTRRRTHSADAKGGASFHSPSQLLPLQVFFPPSPLLTPSPSLPSPHEQRHHRHVEELNENDGGEEEVMEGDDRAIELILLDIDMPGMSGVNVAQRIRRKHGANDVARNVIIIAITTNVAESSVKSYRTVGMDGCVRKPVDVQILRSIIIDAQQRRKDLVEIM